MGTSFTDTILAPASGSGRSAIAILRISGERTLAILERFCHIRSSEGQAELSFSKRVRQMLYCDFYDALSLPAKIIDTGLAVYFQNPYSYTGEDTAELFLHGNPLLLHKMIDVVTASAWARQARPGEFSQRAYLNRKFDLSQAQAVQQIISARSDWELNAARANLQGAIKGLSTQLRQSTLELKASVEAQIDFSDEDDSIPNFTQQKNKVEQLVDKISGVLEQAQASQNLRMGWQVIICGVPNAGKSSLFNCILGWERSLVSEQAGTTRDYVSEEIQLGGCSVRFIDTAGLREKETTLINEIEQAGIQLTRKLMEQSNLILYLIDGSQAPYPMPRELQDLIREGTPIINVLNKCETTYAQLYLEKASSLPLCISCHEDKGMDELRKAITDQLPQWTGNQSALLLEVGQQQSLRHARAALQRILEIIKSNHVAPLEIIALELDQCLEEIGGITTPVDNEEVLGRIFSNFCIGK